MLSSRGSESVIDLTAESPAGKLSFASRLAPLAADARALVAAEKDGLKASAPQPLTVTVEASPCEGSAVEPGAKPVSVLSVRNSPHALGSYRNSRR